MKDVEGCTMSAPSPEWSNGPNHAEPHWAELTMNFQFLCAQAWPLKKENIISFFFIPPSIFKSVFITP